MNRHKLTGRLRLMHVAAMNRATEKFPMPAYRVDQNAEHTRQRRRAMTVYFSQLATKLAEAGRRGRRRVINTLARRFGVVTPHKQSDVRM